MNNDEQAEIVSKLNALILKAVPKAQTVDKYGGTLYTLNPDKNEAQFCRIFQYEKHVQLAFSQGALLKDAKNRLQGSGKHRRHVNFQDEKEIDTAVLNGLLKQAANISAS